MEEKDGANLSAETPGHAAAAEGPVLSPDEQPAPGERSGPQIAAADKVSGQPSPDEPAGDRTTSTLINSLSAGLERVVAEGLDRIIRLIEERQALDRFRENQVEKLHAELQGYKADLVSRAVRPVLQSLIRLHDDMGKVLQALGREDRAALTPEPLIGLLKGFQEDVELALDRNGVKSFRAEVEEFDPRRQTVVRTEKTDDPAQVGRLVERVRPGFEQAEVILEKERVAVYALSTRETQ